MEKLLLLMPFLLLACSESTNIEKEKTTLEKVQTLSDENTSIVEKTSTVIDLTNDFKDKAQKAKEILDKNPNFQAAKAKIEAELAKSKAVNETVHSASNPETNLPEVTINIASEEGK